MANSVSNQDDFTPIPTTPVLSDDLPDFAPIPTDDECGKLRNIDVLLGHRRHHSNSPPLRLDDAATSQSVPRPNHFPTHLSSSPTRIRSKSIHVSPYTTPHAPRSGAQRQRDSPDERYIASDIAIEQRRAQLSELLEHTRPAPEQQQQQHSSEVYHRTPTRRTERRRSHSPDAMAAPEPTYSYPAYGYPVPSPKLPRSRPTTATSTPYPHAETPRGSVISASSVANEAERQRTGSFALPPLGRPAYLRRDSTSSSVSSCSSAKAKPLDTRYPNPLAAAF